MDEKRLLDLEGIGRGTKAVVLAEDVVWHLLDLVIKFLSLGTVSLGASPREREVAAKRKLGEMAAEELARRKAEMEAQPLTARQRALAATTAAVQERKVALEARANMFALSPDPETAAIERVERLHDAEVRDKQDPKHPALIDLLAAADQADANVKQLQAVKPIGWLSSLTGTRAAHERALVAAQRRSAAARRRLELARERVRAAREPEIKRVARELEAERKALRLEIKHLQGRLQHLTAAGRKLEQDVELERLRQVVQSGSEDADKGRGDSSTPGRTV
jgi:hypothetical protein